jgi:beta-glucanase (GH16 family)
MTLGARPSRRVILSMTAVFSLSTVLVSEVSGAVGGANPWGFLSFGFDWSFLFPSLFPSWPGLPATTTTTTTATTSTTSTTAAPAATTTTTNLLGGLGGSGGLGGLFPPPTTTTTAPPFFADTSTVPQSTTSDGKSDCGGATIYKSDGTPWTCTFDDEFDGTTLNTNLWTVEQTSLNGYHSGQECFVDSPNNVSVSGGALHLTAQKEANTFVCNSPQGSYATQYTSGEVYSLDHFSQTYGYFEAKAKFPAATVSGLQSSLWLWPVNPNYYGSTWPASGEIDFTEWYSEYPTLAIPYIHYNPAASDPNVTNDACSVSNTSGYNTYGVMWTPQSITIQIDGKTCLVDNWNPASPEVKPAPFNMPFFINLTQALGVQTNAFNSSTPLPATTSIDWMRVWS